MPWTFHNSKHEGVEVRMDDCRNQNFLDAQITKFSYP